MNDMIILDLVLKGKWYDMIERGAKLEFDVATSCGLEVWYQYRHPASLHTRAMQL